MTYLLTILPAAVKALKNIPEPDRSRIGRRIDRLADIPRPTAVKRLSGQHDLYRIRVGDYRVIYRIKDDVLEVLVIRIGNRKEIYRLLNKI